MTGKKKRTNGAIDNEHPSHIFSEIRHSPEQIKDLFRKGMYPYKTRIKTSVYERHKKELQVELLKVQNWVKQNRPTYCRDFRGERCRRQGRYDQAFY